jgi:hypothetical protein
MAKKSNQLAKLKHEFFKFLWMFAYLFLVFVLFQLREYVVLAKEGIPYTSFGISLIKALVLAKVMLVADDVRLGQMSLYRPVLYPILRRSVLIALVLVAFNIVETIIKGMIKGQTFVESIPVAGSAGVLESAVTAAIMIFMLIPFFGFMELGRVIGFENLRRLLIENRNTEPTIIHESTSDRKAE